MFTTINKKLLTDFPIIWNTRFHIFFPLTLIINVLFFLVGYLKSVDSKKLNIYVENEVGIKLMAILVLLGVGIIWLYNYFKNNALKNIYPIGTNALFFEYCIVFILTYSMVNFSNAYEIGEYINNTSVVYNDKMTLGNSVWPYTLIALALSDFIFSFRITNTRIWFMSIVGAIIISVFMGIIGMSSDERMTIINYFLLLFAFIVCFIILINKQKYKRLAGLMFNWIQWMIPYFILALNAYLEIYQRNSNGFKIQHLRYHWDITYMINLIFGFLIIRLFITRMARKWQAMPEE